MKVINIQQIIWVKLIDQLVRKLCLIDHKPQHLKFFKGKSHERQHHSPQSYENFRKLIWKIYDVIFFFEICMNFNLESSWIFDGIQKALKCKSRTKLCLIF